MSGTLHGSIEHYITEPIYGNLRNMFAAVVRYFDGHSQMTRIASQKGSGSGGTGDIAGWTGDTNYSGLNAFGVWRWDRVDGAKVYILLQWTDNTTAFGASPGGPGKIINGNMYQTIGIQMALDTSGGNPWNGGAGNSDNDGLDSKGATVWAANGGTLVVWPRANGVAGSGVTTKEYCAALVGGSISTTNNRFQILSDDDAIWIAADHGNNGGYNSLFYFGSYTPRSGITPTTNAGYVMICHTGTDTASVPWDTDIGTTAGSAGDEGGAVVDAADGVKILRASGIYGLNNSTQQPNTVSGGYDAMDFFLRMQDGSTPAKYGLFGRIDPDLMSFVYNINTHDTNADKTKVVLGGTTQGLIKWLVRWDGYTTPGSGVTRDGYQF